MTTRQQSLSTGLMGSDAVAVAHPWRLLGIAAGAGLVIETLLHGEPPGIGFALAGLLVAAVALWIRRLYHVRMRAPVYALLAALVFFAGMVGVRASDGLKVINILVVLGLILLVAHLFHRGQLVSLSLGEAVIGVIAAAFSALLSPFVFGLSDLPRSRASISGQSDVVRVLVGVALALPVLLLFTTLFTSADAVYAEYVRSLWDWNVQELISRFFFSVLIAWLAAGVLRHALTHNLTRDHIESVVRQESFMLGVVETVTLLALVDLLFLSLLFAR